ncbi:hypothetical protein JOD54_004480 [Actinokineospora baliensis]|uniref:hypothetical protein n=1 Tax=Actinokineospora baliensis TaxID=547056 RepID=UPI00195C00F5|nr:hypothetical protein [Actinokineospora baliensis]MBM7774276.1 hypothetical protein [Actinokineospora baliensis]
MRPWLEAVFDSHGSAPAWYVEELAGQRRRELVAELVPVVLDQAESALGHRPEMIVAGNTVGHEQVWAVTREPALVAIADAVQSLIASRDRVVWPVCPRHLVGQHPELREGLAVWVCRAGDHVVNQIG